MTDANRVLAKTDDLPIRHIGVHNGKVRSRYNLSREDSQRLIKERGYALFGDARLDLMVMSDRISAFNEVWTAEGGMEGVVGKGAALNHVSLYFFNRFAEAGIAPHHVVDAPHPYLWVVQRANPVTRIEHIARQYITGSMWNDYEQGVRDFCGNRLPDGLKKNQRLNHLLLTPTTKGVITDIDGVEAKEDAKIAYEQVNAHAHEFGYLDPRDVVRSQLMVIGAFRLVEKDAAAEGMHFVDTKFEIGYGVDARGNVRLMFIDEVATPDSSRYWDATEYAGGHVVEESKEGFRQFLINTFGESFLRKAPQEDIGKVAAAFWVPRDVFEDVSNTYRSIAERLTGKPMPRVERPREELSDVLSEFQLIR